MDDLPARWVYEPELEDPNMMEQYYVMNSASDSKDDFNFMFLATEGPQSFLNTATIPSETSQNGVCNSVEQPQHKTHSSTVVTTGTTTSDYNSSSGSASTVFLRFDGNPTWSEKSRNHTKLSYMSSHGSDDDLFDALEAGKKSSKRVHSSGRPSRTPWQSTNHVLAERRRRERMNQNLIALSALIPGRHKMDKTSILGDAIKYIKHLEERVETIQGSLDKIMAETTSLPLKRCRMSRVDGASTSNEKTDIDPTGKFPEVEVRVSDKHVLLRIHCKKQDGIVAKILRELQVFYLNFSCSSILPFGDNSVDITMIAKMGHEFVVEVDDLARNLRSAVLRLV